MTPTDVVTNPDIAQMLTWIGLGFGAATAVLGVLLRLLLGAYKKNMELQLRSMTDGVGAVQVAQKEADGRVAASLQGCAAQIEKQRDRWEAFLKEYHVLDATRGQKVDALFRSVDVMRETLKELKPSIHTKLQDISHQLSNELKLYIRDILKKEG